MRWLGENHANRGRATRVALPGCAAPFYVSLRSEGNEVLSLVLNRSPIIFKNLQINSKSVKEGVNRRIFFKFCAPQTSG